MIGKISFLIFTIFACEGYAAVTQITLPDRELTYIRHNHLGTSIGIAKSFLDTLTNCHIIYPNRVMYEAYPLNRLPHENVFFLTAVDLFRSCSIGFRDVGPEFSGTYELLSTVAHAGDNRVSLTRQRFHLTVIESDFPDRSY